MRSLFENHRDPVIFDVPDAEIVYYPHFFALEKADELLVHLKNEIPWQQDNITIFGKTHPQPRLTALFGNEGKPYSYSNIVMQPHPWNPALTHVREEVEAATNEHFTTVLLNNYRDGRDSNGWHADNERELGRNPVIASVSFGAERFFHLQHNTLKEHKIKILLGHGSLLVMKGKTQHCWKHQIPKTAKPVGARINLTFRTIK